MFRVEDMTRYGWDLLGENPSEIVLGQTGRPWRGGRAAVGPVVAPAAFATYDKPGYAKLAFSLRVDPRGTTSSILTMETRVALTDATSLRRFPALLDGHRPLQRPHPPNGFAATRH